MSKVLIYSFQRTPSSRANVYYDSDNPTVITFDSTSSTGTPSQPPGDIPLASACQPGTTNLLKYYSLVDAPYAKYVATPNSTMCGYTPPACDIQQKDFTVTDETAIGANNGTINFFAVSSYMPITYYITGPDVGRNNKTGYFTNLPPNDYSLSAIDANGCVIQQYGTVHAFDNTKTHYKYRLGFQSNDTPEINSVSWEVRFYDRINNYDNTEYPKDLEGSATPLKWTQQLDNEEKESAIAVKTLDIEIIYDGTTFTTNEFSLSEETSWYVEVYKNGSIDFKGYLLPDGVQDYYLDPGYPFKLTATDGLPSLKGNKWGDGSGGNGYTTDQIPQFGLKRWGILVKQCLDQLGYDYGIVSLVSSLQYNETYNQLLWAKIGTWSDVLYGSDGVPNDTYNCLDLLLQGMGLTIMQHKGEFKLVNWNTMSYANNGTILTVFNKSFYQFSPDFLTTGNVIDMPLIQPVGHNYQLQPVNPTQSVRFDKQYNVQGKVDFNLLALLYPNPSFEIGSVEGALPSGWSKENPVDAFLHNEGNQAYDGQWVFRISGQTSLRRINTIGQPPQNQGDTQFLFMNDTNRWAVLDTIVVDQPNKSLNLSFAWRPVFFDNNKNAVATFIIYFKPQGKDYLYGYSLNYKDPDRNSGWVFLDYAFPMVFVSQRVTDYVGWQNFSITTDAFPEGGIGEVFFAFRSPLVYNPDGPGLGIAGVAGKQVDDGVTHTVDYDDLQLSLVDASESYSKQTGENHLINAVKGRPSNKEVNLQLFTYPPNKRIAGNIFTTDDYVTGEVANKWNYALRSFDDPDRLAAVISRGIARAYQRPLYFWEGDVQTNSIDFYGMFTIKYYEGKIFMPYSIEFDCKNNVASVVLVEIDDSSQQAVYKYVPVYEKSARKNTN